MTLFGLLPAFQEAPLPAIPKEGGWVLSAIMFVVLFWREFTKSRAEREASQVTGYKDMLDRQTVNLAKSEANSASLAVENGRLKDLLSAERIEKGGLAAELKWTKQELAECQAAAESRHGGEGG